MERKSAAYLLVSVVTRVTVKALLVVLVVVASVSAPTSTTQQAAADQRARLQLIVKDALIYRYVPGGATQAISELQASLPGWQAENAALQAIPDSSIQVSVSAGASDYNQITAALRAILTRPNAPVDPVQVDIIRTHEAGYRSALSQVIMLVGQQVAAQRLTAAVLIISITSVLILLSLVDVFVVRNATRGH